MSRSGRKVKRQDDLIGMHRLSKITPPSVSSLHSATSWWGNSPSNPPLCAVIALPLLQLVLLCAYECVCVSPLFSYIPVWSRVTERSTAERFSRSSHPALFWWGKICLKGSWEVWHCFNKGSLEEHPLLSNSSFLLFFCPSLSLVADSKFAEFQSLGIVLCSSTKSTEWSKQHSER